MIYLFEDLLLLFDLHFPTFSLGARQAGEWNVHLFRKYATNRSETYYETCKRILAGPSNIFVIYHIYRRNAVIFRKHLQCSFISLRL